MNEETKKRIREEEIFRKEVSDSLIKPKNSILTFLNSALGIFLLSTIVIPVSIFTYNKISQKHTEKREAIEKIKKLDFEIEGRLSQFLVNMEYLVEFSDDTTYDFSSDSTRQIFNQLWRELKTPPERNQYIYSVHSEFVSVSLTSLIMELSNVLAESQLDVNRALVYEYDNHEDFQVKDLSAQIEEIKNAGQFIITNEIYIYEKQPSAKMILDRVFRELIIQRWSWTFPYVDCGSRSPFC